MDENGVAEAESISFFHRGRDEWFSAFFGLFGEGVGDENSVITAVGPRLRGVFRVGDDEDSDLFPLKIPRVIDPFESLPPSSGTIDFASIVDDAAVPSLDSKRAGDA